MKSYVENMFSRMKGWKNGEKEGRKRNSNCTGLLPVTDAKKDRGKYKNYKDPGVKKCNDT